MLDRFLIAVESIAESLKVLAAGPTDSAPQADAPAEPAKPRGRPRKTVEPAQPPEPQAEAAPVQVQVQVQTQPAFDYNNLKAAIVQLANHSPEGKATAIALCHNHPSGQTQPSREDIELTARAKEAAKILSLTLVDHIIVARDRFYSFADEGKL